MAKAAATLLVLLSCQWPTVQAEPHILSVSFTVKTRSIRIMELTQCSVDGVPFHSDDKNDTRKEGNVPKECADLFPKLTDIEEEFRSQLHTMEQEGDLTTGDHSLQVTVVCLYEKGKPIYGYWNFTLDGQLFFGFNCLDSKNKKCTLTPNKTPGIDKWQNNTNLLRHLETFIRGDSRRCFLVILPQLKKMARSTSRTPDIGIVTSPSQLPSTMNTSQLLSTEQPPSKGGSSVTEGGTPIVIIILRIILAVIISISICIAICICIYKCVKRKSCTQGSKEQTGVSLWFLVGLVC
ncbi:UL16-binding protein 2-like [Alexandromys fortis]|uniref:UL16-binding protein 2-like n=1 Tax=Alexandromys fortis TaxID=100897 RepID=UPI0021524135|nr:UL16-binding protein 2-like [Microtus fortis]